MKISSSLRNLYNQQLDINLLLEKRVRDLIGANKHDNWFYKGRIKQIESFVQKLETGRFRPDNFEDFFACTLVVENKSSIPVAIELVQKYCNIIYKKPKDDFKTTKVPSEFSFDDLRLYVKLKPSDASPLKPINNILFEIQIKTFLQHAWSISTHDLVYKGDSISWGKARLAYQIKAMLEHAEISIEQVDYIANSTDLAIIDPETQKWKDILAWLQATWSTDLLPSNVVGLVQTISKLLGFLKLQLSDIQGCIKKDTADDLGARSMNLSPYETIIKSIVNHKKAEFLAFLNDTSKRKGKLLVTPEMEIEDFIVNANKQRIVFSRIQNDAGFSMPPLRYQTLELSPLNEMTIVSIMKG
jgi:ppGpp synthetase/RelA/SpoT-type nucleotidyltranferase